MLGLGSIVGTGVFVSLGVAAGVAGPAVLVAVFVGALVAGLNGLSSAQLAANHPVSGGTYAYGYRYLNPFLGFTAGWTFLVAKGASAATAALGFAGYASSLLGLPPGWLVPLALGAVVVLTLVVLGGVRRSSLTNIVIVSVTLAALALFVVAGFPSALANIGDTLLDAPRDASRGGLRSVLYASALMFVAYTGYGRIATLGEEVREPRRTIPRAIITTLLVTAVLYAAVAFVGVGAVGAPALGGAAEAGAAPLEVAAESFAPAIAPLVAVGAVTAMLGVLLNLLLGLSRVLLAMGRQGDAPARFGSLSPRSTPAAAVLGVSVVTVGLTLIGDVKTTWSFSAFSVLLYYAITNLAALRLSDRERFFPRWVSAAGLVACLSLAFFVEVGVWLAGLGVVALGGLWYGATRLMRRRGGG